MKGVEVVLDLGQSSRGGRHLPETVALAGRMNMVPSPGRLDLADELISRLKQTGVWQKPDALYVLAAQAARLN